MPEFLVGDPVLRIVEIESGGLDHQLLAALAILDEELPEVDTLDLLMVLPQQRPGGTLRQGL